MTTIKTKSLLAFVVTRHKDSEVTYYSGSDGNFVKDIRRAKMYPTVKAAERSYPYTNMLKYPCTSYWGDLNVKEIRIEY